MFDCLTDPVLSHFNLPLWGWCGREWIASPDLLPDLYGIYLYDIIGKYRNIEYEGLHLYPHH